MSELKISKKVKEKLDRYFENVNKSIKGRAKETSGGSRNGK